MPCSKLTSMRRWHVSLHWHYVPRPCVRCSSGNVVRVDVDRHAWRCLVAVVTAHCRRQRFD